jgi:hypothetical protein
MPPFIGEMGECMHTHPRRISAADQVLTTFVGIPTQRARHTRARSYPLRRDGLAGLLDVAIDRLREHGDENVFYLPWPEVSAPEPARLFVEPPGSNPAHFGDADHKVITGAFHQTPLGPDLYLEPTAAMPRGRAPACGPPGATCPP